MTAVRTDFLLTDLGDEIELTTELLTLGCGEPLPGTHAVPVHEIVDDTACAMPGRSAVLCGQTTLTYAALSRWAAGIAARLDAAGVNRGDRVGLLAEPSAAMVAAALGVLRAGAAYV